MKLLYLLAIGVGTMSSSFLHAQWWTDAGLPPNGANYLILYTDPASNSLYATGNLVDNVGTSEQAMHYCKYQNGSWLTSVPFNHMVFSAVVHQDTLYVGGAFTAVDGTEVTYIARQVDGEWSSAGTFDNAIYSLKVLNGELHAIGDFTYADGDLCQGVAKRVGNGWQAIVPVGCDNCLLKDAVLYEDELVVSGTITFPGNAYRHVVRLHDGEWIPLGSQGIHGSLSAGGQMAVYQGHLYVAGLIDVNSGNAGHAIMRWNGTAWSSVGTGVQDETGGYNLLIRVDDLEVHGGLLYASGGFNYAGNVAANRIATWNGSEWCSVGGDFGDWEVNSIAFLQDTLYAACWDVADGQPVNHLAKFIAPAYEGNCSVPMAVSAVVPSEMRLDPLGGRAYTLRGHSTTSLATLLDASGRITGSWAIHGEAPFQLPAVAAGVHVLFVQGSGAHRLLVLP